MHVTPEDRSGEERARLVLPQLRLDDLLTELRARIETVVSTRDRVHALLEAVVSIGGDLALETVLRRIVEAATTLVDARFGALGVLSDDGDHVVQFITVGITPEEISTIGGWPHGHGILGMLSREPRSLRLSDLTAHPESYGFPGGHPRMRRFLGVPIRARGEIFGNLYLTEKTGGGEFEEDDEVVVSALATAAGVAIENARLYEETRRRERWLQASGEISTALLSGTDPAEVLEMVARRAREICDAEHAMVSLLDDKTQEFVLSAADGEYADDMRGLRVPVEDALVGRVFRSGKAMLVPDARASGNELSDVVPVGATLLVPLGVGDAARGVLSVANRPGAAIFDEPVRRLLEAFGGQAAIALELAERRKDTERLARLEDRDRIAKDLHDTVIQRLFATAMTLMSATKIIDRPEAALRVQRAVDDLDGTIRRIRSTIFALRPTLEDESLRGRLHEIVDAADLGFAPSVRLDGLLDTAVEEKTAEHLLAVVHEALSNVARHARARQATVAVEVDTERVVLRVEDDGVGVPQGGRRSGLRNMADRATDLGGSFEIAGRPGGGTVLIWRAPLPAR